jgi:hypothetical protein
LACNTLSYFNNSCGFADGFAGNGYPNPYSDPNNPYYRKSNPTIVQHSQTYLIMMKITDIEKAQMKQTLMLKKHNNQKLNKKWERRN